MQLGACLAGLAIENSMLGAGHALANPLTAAYGVAHGEAVALMLPHVVRRNGAAVERRVRRSVGRRVEHTAPTAAPAAAAAVADFLAESAASRGPRRRDCAIKASSATACRNSPPTRPNNGPARSTPSQLDRSGLSGTV